MKKRHIALAVYLVIFKIIVIASLIYIGYSLVEIKTGLVQTQNAQTDLQKQITENQQNTQAQINEIGTSLLSTKKDLSEEISQLKADTSSDFSEVIQDVIPGVVSIGTDITQGSGFIISPEGYIITNAHVLSGGKVVKVLTYEDKRWIPAQLVGYDSIMDIAIIKIPGDNYKYLTFESSSNLQVGEKAIALGNPLGLSFSVSEGIISALNRQGPNQLPAYIQIDVPLNRGNSGGPLVSKKGKVIGVNNFKLQNSENLGFALESDYAIETINTIFENQNLTVSV